MRGAGIARKSKFRLRSKTRRPLVFLRDRFPARMLIPAQRSMKSVFTLAVLLLAVVIAISFWVAKRRAAERARFESVSQQ